ncbi:MAG: DUF1016 N-terminal domain-containing protein [Elusimicrobiota bacterium]|jgi:predicted nuclease of restriction endonuclease-like (RecB) superfamily|nr:DUF1016 N-terminal domain-containing protein [Elusimicrobiota bacterium]
MLLNDNEYLSIVKDIKTRIKNAQLRAVLSANKELILLYWNIGKIINERKSWGNKFIDNLARDIKADFPDMTGFSIRNLKYMAKFASVYPDIQFVQTLSAQLTWSHNVALLDKVDNDVERNWYAHQTIKNGWALNIMKLQIKSALYNRQAIAKKTTNFSKLLPKPQSKLAEQTIKDLYVFDFMPIKAALNEANAI